VDLTVWLHVRVAGPLPPERAFGLATERERVGSVLSDLTKTGGDFHSMAAAALDGVAEALLARMRPILEEVGTVRGCSWR
jgi:hypothetical protein